MPTSTRDNHAFYSTDRGNHFSSICFYEWRPCVLSHGPLYICPLLQVTTRHYFPQTNKQLYICPFLRVTTTHSLAPQEVTIIHLAASTSDNHMFSCTYTGHHLTSVQFCKWQPHVLRHKWQPRLLLHLYRQPPYICPLFHFYVCIYICLYVDPYVCPSPLERHN